MSGEYGGCGKTSPFERFKYFFTTLAKYFFSDMTPSVVMKKNNYHVFARIPAVFLAMHGSNESIVADRP